MQRAAPSDFPEAPLSSSVDRVLDRLASLSGSEAIRALTGNELLMERSWLSGSRFQAGRSTNGSTRLLPTRDGVLAIGLVRPEDWSLVPAWLQATGQRDWQAGEDAWQQLAGELSSRDTGPLLNQGRLLGLPLAATGTHRDRSQMSFSGLFTRPPDSPRRHNREPRVVDLTALWAGPLCTHLLGLCGARVIKVESSSRPDGARQGDKAFYGLLNQGKRSVALDLSDQAGRQALSRLIESADIVVESSRPRALRQLGISAEDILARKPELAWISITGYGRGEPEANWVAFGDDAGVAAGLSDLMFTATGDYQLAGDAIADPLTGSHAALAAWSSWSRGVGGLISLPLSDVAAWCLSEELAEKGERQLAREFERWWGAVADKPPRSNYPGRPIDLPVADSGVHTARVMKELNTGC